MVEITKIGVKNPSNRLSLLPEGPKDNNENAIKEMNTPWKSTETIT